MVVPSGLRSYRMASSLLALALSHTFWYVHCMRYCHVVFFCGILCCAQFTALRTLLVRVIAFTRCAPLLAVTTAANFVLQRQAQLHAVQYFFNLLNMQGIV
jgi:hypothetical protein